MQNESCDIGLIGLAVMGQNLVLNMNDHGFTVVVFNRTVSKVDEFLDKEAKGTKVIGAHSIEEMVQALKKPRRVMMMVKAGDTGGRIHRAADSRTSNRATSSSTAATRFIPDTDRRDQERRVERACSTSAPAFPAAKKARAMGRASCPAVSALRGRTSKTIFQAHRRQSRRRHALLRLGRRRRRRPLREDGPQRHRIRRHAAHLRGLPADEATASA